MRLFPLLLALALAACGAPAPAQHGLDGLLARLEAADAEALEPAVRALAAEPGNILAQDRFRAALAAVPVSRGQAERVLAPVFPGLAKDLVAERATRLSASAAEAPLAEAVLQAAARLDDWITPVPAGERTAPTVRIRRIAGGDAFELVLRRGHEPIKDAVRRVDCPAPVSCAAPSLARVVLELLAQ